MIQPNEVYLVMGLLDTDSIAYSIGKTIEQFGGKVIYTVQSEKFKRVFFDRSPDLTDEQKERMSIMFCDVTREDEVQRLFEQTGNLAGIVHSIAYANPKTCLGEEFHTDAQDDILLSYKISCMSLACVARYGCAVMPDGGSIVTMTFDSGRAYSYYNWMGVHKAALEALVRALARRHGKDLIRVNAVSAGPLSTKAATHIPGFGELSHAWAQISPLPWDEKNDKQEVANLAVFLLGHYSKKITGQTIFVDGGASAVGGRMMPHERPFE
ncbi:MAG: SDR family oxidoreductase [Candidatus Auribacterota bacterium]|jgi:enoyl-[acyl-carrier protein] reductase I|nr:SDR family oxidoreductase [Candidatus Auribacterota bacterium]